MQSIKKFFSPKKNEDESDFSTAKNKGRNSKNSKDSLLKIVDNEVEDITGLLFETLNGESGVNKIGKTDESSKNLKAEPEDCSLNPIPCANLLESKAAVFTKENKPEVPKTSTSDESVENATPACNNQNLSKRDSLDKSPVSNRTRRFSFHIKSPLRTPKKNTNSLSRPRKDIADSSFDEALSITVNNDWANSKDDPDVEVIHPKKRLKTGSSEAQSISCTG
jgi:hypothetical protein